MLNNVFNVFKGLAKNSPKRRDFQRRVILLRSGILNNFNDLRKNAGFSIRKHIFDHF